MHRPDGNAFDIETHTGAQVFPMSYWVTKYFLFQSPKQILAKVNREGWVDKDDHPEIPFEEDRLVMSKSREYLEEQKKLLQKGKEDNVTMVEVSVRIWFTKKFAAMEEDIQGGDSVNSFTLKMHSKYINYCPFVGNEGLGH